LTIEARTDDFFKDLPEAIEVLREVLSAKWWVLSFGSLTAWL
jgi:hypothetical protein